MFLSRAVSLVGVAVALAGPFTAQAPADGVDLVPALTSAPFGAVGGQSVTHTILVSGNGTGTVAGVRVTFTTTVGLDGANASTTQGSCSVADALTVVCDLGVVDLPTADAAPPKVTISGTVTPKAARGTLVQNLVKVSSSSSDSDVSNNAASNAYLIPGASGPASRPAAAPSSSGPARTPGYLMPVAAGVLVVGVLASVIALRRRRR